MALDHVRLARLGAGGLDDVRIDRALRQNSMPVSLCASSSNTSMKRLPMILRLASGSVTPASADRNRCSASTRMTRTPRCSREGLHHLVAFVQAQQAVIDEHAGELIADRRDAAARRRRRNPRRRTAPAAPSRRRPARARARTRVFDDVAGMSQALAAAADLVHEAREDARALLRVRDFRMELHAVETPRSHPPCPQAARLGVDGDELETRRQLRHAVAVAHPDIEQSVPFGIRAVFDALEQLRMPARAHLARSRTPMSRGSTAPPSCCAIVCMP